MNLVYRLEDILGYGVYRANQTRIHIRRKDHFEACPPPIHDEKLGRVWGDLLWCHYKFGFKNLKQLRSWFQRHTLKRLSVQSPNITIGVYRVAEMIEGDKQIISKEFKPENLVERISIEKYLEVTSQKRVLDANHLLTLVSE